MEKRSYEKEGEIWAVGSGKGGTGKSFITTCLGIYLAKKGRSVVLIDADIGGATLHSFFGINKPDKSLTDFFEKDLPLDEIAVNTGIDNMSLITGDIGSLASDNSITLDQKYEFFNQIMTLRTQHVLIDIGAGSHNDTLDTFLMADKKVAVLVPELIAVENMYHFVKNALFRKLKIAIREQGFKEIVEFVWKRREINKLQNLKELIDYLKDFPDLEPIVDQSVSDFKIYLVLNIVRTKEDIYTGSGVKSTFMKYLGINTQYVGFIEEDDAIRESIRQRKPYLLNNSASRSAKEIQTVAENLIQEKDLKF